MSKKKKQQHIKLDKADKALLHQAIEQEVKRLGRKNADDLCDYAVVATAKAAIDYCGLKGDKLKAFVDNWLLQFDCLVAETVSLEDLKELVKVEGGLELHVKKLKKGRRLK